VRKYAVLFGCAYAIAAALVCVTVCLFAGCSKKVAKVEIPQMAYTPPAEPAPVEPEMISDKPLIPMAAEPAPKSEPQEMTVFFDFDRSDLTESTTAALGGIAKNLLQGKSPVKIVGACSPEGSSEYNLALSVRRAQSVKDFLVSYGIEAERIDVSGVGEEMLVSTIEAEYWKDRNATITME
jgi:outer membrane protein OmpA-like peptidoglycan-associated protein